MVADCWPFDYRHLGLGRPSRMADWTFEQRSASARIGWETRRRKQGALWNACRRFELLLEMVEPRELRLYACSVVEELLPVYEQAYAGDACPRLAVQVARRYARGQAEEGERLAAWRLAGFAAERLYAAPRPCVRVRAVIEAAAWALHRSAPKAAYWSLLYCTDAAGGEGHGLAHFLRHGAILEAMTVVAALGR